MLPGLLLFPSEAALTEKVGSLLMLGLTLAGLYLLLARPFGDLTAVIACVVFALSDRGFFFAGTLWPRAHPAFLVWFVYFSYRWLEGRRYALACALAIWFAGAYWMLEGVPSILVLPLVWLAYRSRVRWREIFMALVAGALIWSPYLGFEAKRGFVDLRALLSRTNLRPDFDADVRNSLSNPDLKMFEKERPHKTAGNAQEPYHWTFDQRIGWMYRAVDESIQGGIPGRWTFADSLGGWVFRPTFPIKSTLAMKMGKLWKLILASMPATLVPAGAAVLFFLFVSSALWGFASSIVRCNMQRWTGLLKALCWVFALVLGMEAIEVIAHAPMDFDLTKTERISLVVFCALSCLGLTAFPFAFVKADSVIAGRQESLGQQRFLLAAVALVPWMVIMLLVARGNDPDVSRRFIWLWVVQGALMVVFLRELPVARLVRALALSCLIVLVTLNPNCIAMTASWYRNGLHSLPANDLNNAIDFLGRRIKAEGRASARIGYDVPFFRWMVAERMVDGVSKVGREIDTVFRMRHGITNLDTNAEGISRDDEFRIVDLSQQAWGETYFDLSGYPEMTTIYTSPTFTVLSGKAGAINP